MACASGVLSDSEKKSNFTKLSRLLIDAGTPSLRRVLDNIHSPGTGPGTLADFLASNRSTVEAKLYSSNPRKKKHLSKVQWETLYPLSGSSSSSKDFDISLLFTLLREGSICGLTPPPTGWDTLPSHANCSLEANLARIKYYRNEIYGHIITTEVEETDFERYWNDLSKAILSFGVVSQKELDILKSSPLGEKDYTELLEQWCRSDCDIAAEIVGLSSKFQAQMAIQSAQIADLKTEMLAEIKKNKAPELDIHVDCIGATPNFTDDERERKEHLKMYMHYMVEVLVGQVNTMQEEHELVRRFNAIGAKPLYLAETNSLCITVRCLTLDSLRTLWYEYTSGNLNREMEKFLVTQEILDKYQLTSVQLRTTIHEEEYKRCLDFFASSNGTEYRTDDLVVPSAHAHQQQDDAGDSKSGEFYGEPELDIHFDCEGVTPDSTDDAVSLSDLHDMVIHEIVDGYLKIIRSTQVKHKLTQLLLNYGLEHLYSKETQGLFCITARCSNLNSLRILWYEYTSGHLNKRAEEYLVTQEILDKYQLTSVQLKTTIHEEEYERCLDFFARSKGTEYRTEELVIPAARGHQQGEHQKQDVDVPTSKIGEKREGGLYGVTGHYREVIESQTTALETATETGDKSGECTAYEKLGNVYQSLGNYNKAKKYHTKQLDIARAIDDKRGEGRAYENLGKVHQSLGDYKRAIEYYRKQLDIARAIDDKRGKGRAYESLGNDYRSLGDYFSAIENHTKQLDIARAIGDKSGKGRAYESLGKDHQSLGNYEIAIEYHTKQLDIARAIDDKSGEGRAYESLGKVHQSLGDYKRAIEYYRKQLDIARAIDDKRGKGRAYESLGNDYRSLGDYFSAIENHTKQLDIARAIGDKSGKGRAYESLGKDHQSLGNYEIAIEYHTKQLDIARAIDDKRGKGRAYESLGNDYRSLGDYFSAIENHTKQLDIARAIGDKSGKGRAYESLGKDHQSLGNYEIAIEYHTKQLDIARAIDDKRDVGRACGNLERVYRSLGDIHRANEYHQKLSIIAKIMGLSKSEFDA